MIEKIALLLMGGAFGFLSCFVFILGCFSSSDKQSKTPVSKEDWKNGFR